ncbi:hypothetical protein OH76DRAFT_1332841, partial [Lentinus brumalis]
MVGRPHAQEVKEQAYVLTLAGFDAQDVAFILGVSNRRIRRWLEHMKQHGDVEAKISWQGLGWSTVVWEEVRDLVRSYPSVYLDEIMSWVAVNHGQHISIATIHCGLVSLGITYKKLDASAAQCDEITRAQWLADITSRFTAQQLVFADESSKDNWTSFRHYGHAPTG